MAVHKCDFCNKTATTSLCNQDDDVCFYHCLTHAGEAMTAFRTYSPYAPAQMWANKNLEMGATSEQLFTSVKFYREFVVEYLYWVPSLSLEVRIYSIDEQKEYQTRTTLQFVRIFEEKDPIYHARNFIQKFMKNLHSTKGGKTGDLRYRQECKDLYRNHEDIGKTKFFVTIASDMPLPLAPAPKPKEPSWLERWQIIADQLSDILDEYEPIIHKSIQEGRHKVRFSEKTSIVHKIVSAFRQEDS